MDEWLSWMDDGYHGWMVIMDGYVTPESIILGPFRTLRSKLCLTKFQLSQYSRFIGQTRSTS